MHGTPSSIRTRWAAIGAAVAVTLGGGGIGLVAATSPGDAAAYSPITPCRIIDTRSNPEFNVGERDTPIGADETHTITAHGSPGECDDIPATAGGLQLNVTALDATTPTFLAIWGAGDQPNASSLNPAPGQPPTPNAVTTGLDADGEFRVYNKAGLVDVIIDVVGLYTDHDHDDRYYTEDEIDELLAPALLVVPASAFTRGAAEWTLGPDTIARGLGAHGCATAPISLPIGASVASVSMTYEQPGSADVDVVFQGTSLGAGPIADTAVRAILDLRPIIAKEPTRGRAAAAPQSPVIAERGHAHALAVCSSNAVIANAVTVVFD